MTVCILCNSLAEAEKRCPLCGSLMLDSGTVQDYYDNYSPYLDREIYEDGYKCYGEANCTHLFSCPKCGYNSYLAVPKIAEDRLME